jgi:hypothetical protein
LGAEQTSPYPVQSNTRKDGEKAMTRGKGGGGEEKGRGKKDVRKEKAMYK